MNLVGLPIPYTQADWDSWFPIHSKAVDEAIEEWKAMDNERNRDAQQQGWKNSKWMSKGIPFPVIREVGEKTGAETFLGEISIRRAGFIMIFGRDEKQKMRYANDALEAGDPNIEWGIGFYLSPPCHGRGIMPAVLECVLEKVCVPYMNIHRLTRSYLDHNWGSRRVFEKCGFTFDCAVPGSVEMDEGKTRVKGKRVGIERMKWNGRK
ncbi:hypothetical protein BKA65DRAFT_503536 [Rhexocercosporidium sp. MPI-PUGE-AT-0058]|nr:hypothetical protein BKA65DRAFT_503536 [Rhexocercosporidium sp. MPI-PUGE-AT-0058]